MATRSRSVSAVIMSLTITVAILLLAARPVAAHEYYDSGYTWENGIGKCVSTDSGIKENSNNQPISRGYVYATREFDYPGGDPVSCAVSWNKISGQLKVDPDLWKWSAPTGQWTICRNAAARTNGSTTSDVGVQYSWANNHCGYGYYAANTYGGVFHDNAWRGSRLWSTHHQPALG